MRVTLPLAVVRERSGTSSTHRLRPLFAPLPEVRGAELDQARAQLGLRLRAWLEGLSGSDSALVLARGLFRPDLTASRLDITFALRRRRIATRLFAVSFGEGSPRTVLLPWVADPTVDRLPGVPQAPLLLQLPRGQKLADAVQETVLRAFHRADESQLEDLVRSSHHRATWIEDLNLDLQLVRTARHPGRAELEAVGIRLAGGNREEDLLPPQAWARELEECERALSTRPPTPLVIVGEKGCGKSTLIEELARRLGAQAPAPRETWLLTPGRLIAGMANVGQWEARLLAILAAARDQDVTLVLDDLPGLCRVGRSRHTTTGMGSLIADALAREPLPVVAEATPDELRLARELQPGLVDRLHPVVLATPSQAEIIPRVLSLVHDLEARHEVEITPPTLARCLRRSSTEPGTMAQPGAVAQWLSELARRHRGGRVGAGELEDFLVEHTGLRRDWIDPEPATGAGCDRLTEELGRHVVGQVAAVRSMAEVLTLIRAQLAPPGRPLACLLLEGPPGVGKTTLARAVAETVLGSARELTRVDMRDLSHPGDASRLLGSAARDGILTGAIRSQPRRVILLDHVEAAHPQVHDVLLQILGEGRLGDGWGRPVDFSGCIFLLCSSLGGAGSPATTGFGEGHDVEKRAFATVRRFFRPELFNRFDRVLAFHPLGLEELREIASRVLDQVLRREGCRRRKLLVQVDPEVDLLIAERAAEGDLGARGVTRVVERVVTEPMAVRLAGHASTEPSAVRLEVHEVEGGEELHVALQPLAPAPATPPSWRTSLSREQVSLLLEAGHAAVTRIRAELEQSRPAGAVDSSTLDAERMRYFAAREQLQDVEDRLAREADRLEASSRHRRRPSRGGARSSRTTRSPSPLRWLYLSPDQIERAWEAAFAADDPAGELQRLVRDFLARDGERRVEGAGEWDPSRLRSTFSELSLLAVLSHPSDTPDDRGRLRLTTSDIARGAPWFPRMVDHYQHALVTGCGITLLADPQIDGAHADLELGGTVSTIAPLERGAWLWLPEDGSRTLVSVSPVDEVSTEDTCLVRRILHEHGPSLDLAAGLIVRERMDASTFRRMITCSLPPVAEVRQILLEIEGRTP